MSYYSPGRGGGCYARQRRNLNTVVTPNQHVSRRGKVIKLPRCTSQIVADGRRGVLLRPEKSAKAPRSRLEKGARAGSFKGARLMSREPNSPNSPGSALTSFDCVGGPDFSCSDLMRGSRRKCKRRLLQA
jgi:hypothetical protein